MFRESGFLRSLCAVTTLVAAAVAHGQNINVTAANASNDAIYSVFFNNSGGGSTSVLNSDGGSLHNLTSLVFRTNPATFQLDLLAADNGGRIVIYPGDFQFGGQSFGNPVPLGPPGPANPDGLSVDNAGDLFVVNAKPGSTSNPQLWVLQTNPADVAGGFSAPQMLDSNYASTEVLAETLVASTTVSLGAVVVHPGDLLVLTSSPGQVLLYPGSNGNGPLTPCAPPGPTGCMPAVTPTVLIALPTGIIPGGMSFWPVDNSLLITTTRGTILQYHFPAQVGDPANFQNIALGNGQFKIKTGVQFGQPFAYVANNNGGDILRFGLNSQNTVTSGVQHPQGLAVTNQGYAPLNVCQAANGCDPLGNEANQQKVLLHNIPAVIANLGNKNIIENVCVVAADPRDTAPGVCTGTLSVNQVCPGFDNSNKLVIPPTLCGGSGASGKGFALVAALDQAYQNQPGNSPHPFNGYQINTDSNVDNVLPPLPNTINPSCNPPSALGALAWAPLAGEGLDPDGANGTNLIEITSGCDSGTGRISGLSLFGLGLVTNISDQVANTNNKYSTLFGTIQGVPAGCSAGSQGMICPNEGPVLSPPVAQQPPTPDQQFPAGNFTNQLLQCLSTSQATFQQGVSLHRPDLVDAAAVELLAADNQIAGAALMSPPFTPSPSFAGDYPNPSALLQMLIENIYYNIETRLRGYTAGKTGPPSLAPAPQLPAKSPKFISGTPATSVKAGNPYSFIQPVVAQDFAGLTSNLSFSIQKQPPWSQFDPATGVLSGTPAQKDKGTYAGIVISVTDGCAPLTSLPAFTIKVTG